MRLSIGALGLAAWLALGCGGDDGGRTGQDAAPGGDRGEPGEDAAPSPDAAPPPDGAPRADADSDSMTLTSPALDEGGVFAALNTCSGDDLSPALTWTPGPAGTLSYAVVLIDDSNSLTHWVLYDVPAEVTSLPADVDKVYAPPDVPGAHQTASFSAQVRGYLGPCPPSEHAYTFTVFALDVATLPGATSSTSRAAALATIREHALALATLSGTYAPP